MNKPKLLKLKVSQDKWGAWESLYECACGKKFNNQKRHVESGRVISCGCYVRIKHGKFGTSEYKAWGDMKNRCTNPKAAKYKDYGGRGITVCSSWLESFESFYKDLGDRPSGRSLDRIDNEKGYSKDNCRWATMVEQNNNKRNNVSIKKAA